MIKHRSLAILKVITIISIIIYAFLIVIYKLKIGVDFTNNDNYGGAFKTFLELGAYDGIANGTSIFYNMTLKFVNYFLEDINWSFLFVNTLSHLFLILFGYHLLKKIGIKKNIYFYITVGLFVFYLINQNYFKSASNDTFFAIFVVIILNFLIFKIYEKRYLNYYFILLGVLLAVCFAIRPVAIYLIPITIFSLLIWFKKAEIKNSNKAAKFFLTAMSFLLLSICFHYPSLKENGSLSFYDKRPVDINENWIQRNYLGWKKIEEGKESMNRDAIWMNTKFKDVKNYLKENGEDSLPRTFLEVLKKDPILVAKITSYNIVYSGLRFLRFWGFLLLFLIIPFFKFKKESIQSKVFLSSSIFIAVILMISFTCLTFIEERWFMPYEILIPMSILFYLKDKELEKYKLNTVFSLSLILVSIMNLRSIISYL